MLDVNHKTLFFLVFLLTIIINFGVSLLVYYKKFGLFKKRPEGFLGITTFGFIEDAVIMPLVNVLALSILLDAGLLPTKTELMLFLFVGFSFSIFVHVLFSMHNWEIWLMEEPWEWNAAGRWHMISLALQLGYLFLVGYILLDDTFVFRFPEDNLKFKIILLLLSLFALLFVNNEEGIKLGKVKIKNRTW